MTERTTGKQPADGADPGVDHPEHYNAHPSGVECIEVVRHMGFNLGNVVKYLWRDGIKNTGVPLQDLEKALWYLTDEIEQRKAMYEQPWSPPEPGSLVKAGEKIGEAGSSHGPHIAHFGTTHMSTAPSDEESREPDAHVIRDEEGYEVLFVRIDGDNDEWDPEVTPSLIGEQVSVVTGYDQTKRLGRVTIVGAEVSQPDNALRLRLRVSPQFAERIRAEFGKPDEHNEYKVGMGFQVYDATRDEDAPMGVRRIKAMRVHVLSGWRDYTPTFPTTPQEG